jgi:hypothetical protein
MANEPNQVYLYVSTTDYPGVLPDDSIPENLDAYVDLRDGIDPVRARIFMTAVQFAALPSGVREGTTACGIKMSGRANAYSPSSTQDIGDRTIIFAANFYVIRATVCRAGPSSSGPSAAEAFYEVLLATQQYFWRYRVFNKVYNVLDDDKTAFAAGATSSTAAKTYANIVTDLESALSVTLGALPFTPNAKPHNFVCRRVPGALALQRLLRPLGVRVCPNPYVAAIANPMTFSLKRLDYSVATDMTLLTDLAAVVHYDGNRSTYIPDQTTKAVVPEKIDVLFRKWPQEDPSGPTDDTNEQWTAVEATNPATGSLAGTKDILYVGEHFDVTGKTYTEVLADIASERGTCYFKRVNIPYKIHIFVGGYPIPLGEQIRRVKITMGNSGWFTTVWQHGLWEPSHPEFRGWDSLHAPTFSTDYADALGQVIPRDDGAVDILGGGAAAAESIGTVQFTVHQMLSANQDGWDDIRGHQR